MKIFNSLKNNYTKIVILSSLFIPSIVLAQFSITENYGLTDNELDVILENIIIWILGFIGILGILFLVYGGIMYVTSAGDESKAEEGKKTITYAIIGLFVTASAYAIVKTVVGLIG